MKTRKHITQRRAGRKVNKKISYNFRGNVQTYGPGATVVNVDYDIKRDITGEQLLDYSIQSLLVGSDQFYKYREQYNLFKITNFYVIMFPDDNANNENTYLNVDWFNTINIDNIQTCEWSKIMYNDRKNRVTFRFKPLNMNIEQNRTPDTAVINPRQYIYCSSIASYPGHIKIYHNGDTKIRCKIVFRILFRRPEPPVQQEEIEPYVISRVEKDLNKNTLSINNNKNFNKDFEITNNNFFIKNNLSQELKNNSNLRGQQKQRQLTKKYQLTKQQQDNCDYIVSYIKSDNTINNLKDKIVPLKYVGLFHTLDISQQINLYFQLVVEFINLVNQTTCIRDLGFVKMEYVKNKGWCFYQGKNRQLEITDSLGNTILYNGKLRVVGIQDGDTIQPVDKYYDKGLALLNKKYERDKKVEERFKKFIQYMKQQEDLIEKGGTEENKLIEDSKEIKEDIKEDIDNVD